MMVWVFSWLLLWSPCVLMKGTPVLSTTSLDAVKSILSRDFLYFLSFSEFFPLFIQKCCRFRPSFFPKALVSLFSIQNSFSVLCLQFFLRSFPLLSYSWYWFDCCVYEDIKGHNNFPVRSFLHQMFNHKILFGCLFTFLVFASLDTGNCEIGDNSAWHRYPYFGRSKVFPGCQPLPCNQEN